MSQLAPCASYVVIEDQLDAIGQKYRILRLVRGLMLWGTAAVVTTFAALAAAHFIGQSRWTSVVLWSWWGWLALSGAFWVVRPLIMRPRPVEVARLIESRMPELNNGLTNSVLLANASDLQSSPWLQPIFDEVLAGVGGRPLGQAVRFSDLRPLGIKLAIIVTPLLLALFSPQVRAVLQHGQQQSAHPDQFVPQKGRVVIDDISPKDILLGTGQQFAITIKAHDPEHGSPKAKLIFEHPEHKELGGPIDLEPLPGEGGGLLYEYIVPQLEHSTEFRVEIDGTQSPWCRATIKPVVKVQEITFKVMPPTYTHRPPRVESIPADQIEKTPVTVPEGSFLEVSYGIDVPIDRALLQVGGSQGQPMVRGADGQRFTGSLTVLEDTTLMLVPIGGGNQTMPVSPNTSLTIRCTKDVQPQVDMRWPTKIEGTSVPPQQPVTIKALGRDDYGISASELWMSTNAKEPLKRILETKYPDATSAQDVEYTLPLKPEQCQHGSVVTVQLKVKDNRDLVAVYAAASKNDAGLAQWGESKPYEIRFEDPAKITQEQKRRQEEIDKLRVLLTQMLDQQKALQAKMLPWKAGDKQTLATVEDGQAKLKGQMELTAKEYKFSPEDKPIQTMLSLLAAGTAKEAVEYAQLTAKETVADEQLKTARKLTDRQRRIVQALERILAMLSPPLEPASRPTSRSSTEMPADQKEAFKKLAEDLKDFIKEEQRILDKSQDLAKKPVDNYDENDKKLLEELKQSQEKMDAFMQEKVNDFSKLAEQDMANASMLKEMLEVYSEVTMAKDALKKQAVEIAVPLEESGLELAKDLKSNIEKWLMDKPDREQWTMEEPTGKTDTPMAELPKELEDMVGELMEQQEDLFDEMEDATSSWADSLDKGAGWDAADGPIANMSAKGVTGNQLPNNNEMNGRSGQGRSGKSSGEMVEETANDKGGRNTPTRLDPTPFQKGEVKDESKNDPVGGATGGGKTSGEGGAGLEGPLAPKVQKEMQRLADKQAQIRNNAERLNLEYKLGKYDAFGLQNLQNALGLMRRVEADLKSNRYDNALLKRNVTLDRIDMSKLLLGTQVEVQQDTTQAGETKRKDKLSDSTGTQYPPEWSEALKQYYDKLAGH